MLISVQDNMSEDKHVPVEKYGKGWTNECVTINTPLALILPQFAVFHCLSDGIVQLLL